MEEVKKENENVSKKIQFEFEVSNICIARKEPDDTSIFKDFLTHIFHFSNERVEECKHAMDEDGKRILVGPYARDVAKTLVYRTTCFLNERKDDNYTLYIKEDI